MAPSKFPDSTPLIHLLVSHGCFPLQSKTSSHLCLGITFIQIPHSSLPFPHLIETLAKLVREIRLWSMREPEKHDIHLAEMRDPPLATAPAMNEVFRGQAWVF
ncbi:hypothetical protein XENOCAPTIV_001836 [Xenoophorus captivus]|uniref:Uncharacterized protein n=1 Tax=Xenoophorus captivus TaxID=1517983 RepID=A0ABV0QH18_9TELE